MKLRFYRNCSENCPHANTYGFSNGEDGAERGRKDERERAYICTYDCIHILKQYADPHYKCFKPTLRHAQMLFSVQGSDFRYH